jgi:toxin-antitoxin system PIN domain toxin
VVAADTNILVYAHRSEFEEHRAARALLASLAEGSDLWGLPVFCLGEFLRVVTHPAVLKPPSDLSAARRSLEALLSSPSLHVLTPGDRYPELLLQTVAEAGATGNLVFDAQIAAVCREQGVETLYSNDRDFARFKGIKVRRLTG